jgi:hypothetical protein
MGTADGDGDEAWLDSALYGGPTSAFTAALTFSNQLQLIHPHRLLTLWSLAWLPPLLSPSSPPTDCCYVARL